MRAGWVRCDAIRCDAAGGVGDLVGVGEGGGELVWEREIGAVGGCCCLSCRAMQLQGMDVWFEFGLGQ